MMYKIFRICLIVAMIAAMVIGSNPGNLMHLYLPPAPKGTWWDDNWFIDAHGLYSDDGTEIAAYVNHETFLYECGINSVRFKDRSKALDVAAQCGAEYIAIGEK